MDDWRIPRSLADVQSILHDLYHATLKGQWTPLPDPKIDLSEKTVIVTGANIGLGKESARKYASMKAEKLILAVRTISKGEEARKDILAQDPSLSGDAIEVWPLDMCDFSSVKAFSDRSYAELKRLDILVLNAGIAAEAFELTKDGWESALQTNGLATFYLAFLLLPLLRQTSRKHYRSGIKIDNTISQPRLTIVASALHFLSKLSEKSSPKILEAMNDPKRYSGVGRYEATKLMEVFFARTLAQRISDLGENLHVNSVHPGFCYSNFGSNSPAYKRAAAEIARAVMARTTEEGARAIIWATLCGVEPGAYSTDCIDAPPSPFVTSQVGIETQQRCWDEIWEVLEKLDPSIKSSLQAA